MPDRVGFVAILLVGAAGCAPCQNLVTSPGTSTTPNQVPVWVGGSCSYSAPYYLCPIMNSSPAITQDLAGTTTTVGGILLVDTTSPSGSMPAGTLGAPVLYSPETGLDPRAFGAVFDGINDDTTDTDSAMSYICSTLGEGKLLLPAGTSEVGKHLTVCGGMTITGQGKGATGT